MDWLRMCYEAKRIKVLLYEHKITYAEYTRRIRRLLGA